MASFKIDAQTTQFFFHSFLSRQVPTMRERRFIMETVEWEGQNRQIDCLTIPILQDIFKQYGFDTRYAIKA